MCQACRLRCGAWEGWGTPFLGYLQAFDQVRSHFNRVMDSDQLAVLEWTSECLFPDWERIRFDGVSILEFADGRVQRHKIANEATGS